MHWLSHCHYLYCFHGQFNSWLLWKPFCYKFHGCLINIFYFSFSNSLTKFANLDWHTHPLIMNPVLDWHCTWPKVMNNGNAKIKFTSKWNKQNHMTWGQWLFQPFAVNVVNWVSNWVTCLTHWAWIVRSDTYTYQLWNILSTICLVFLSSTHYELHNSSGGKQLIFSTWVSVEQMVSY